MKNSLISVIIPTYNNSELDQAIKSVLRQSYGSIEIIVVDDGSDTPVEVFDVNVRLIRQENKGLPAARNAGLKVANGEYVKFLDADDILFPGILEAQYNHLCNVNKTICIAGIEIHWNDKRDVVNFKFNTLKESLFYSNISHIHTVLYRTKDVMGVGGFDESGLVHGGHEDYHLHCKLALAGFNAFAISDIAGIYYKKEGTMSTDKNAMYTSRRNVWLYYISNVDLNSLRVNEYIGIWLSITRSIGFFGVSRELLDTLGRLISFETYFIHDKKVRQYLCYAYDYLENFINKQASEKDHLNPILDFLSKNRYESYPEVYRPSSHSHEYYCISENKILIM